MATTSAAGSGAEGAAREPPAAAVAAVAAEPSGGWLAGPDTPKFIHIHHDCNDVYKTIQQTLVCARHHIKSTIR